MKYANKSDLTKFFDKLEVDLKSDLSDWHKVRKELQSAKLHNYIY